MLSMLHNYRLRTSEENIHELHSVYLAKSDTVSILGGWALRALLDHLSQQLADVTPAESSLVPVGGGGGRDGWQLQAASVVTLITETVFGASPSWQPDPGCACPLFSALSEHCHAIIFY